MIRRSAVILLLGMVVAGCDTVQTSFGADADESVAFVKLFWIFLGVTAFTYLLVIGFLLMALLNRRARERLGKSERHREDSPLLRPMLIGWGALVTAGLAVLTLASFLTDRSMAHAASTDQLQIEVTGNQWWWEVRYLSPDVSRMVRTANELHLPLGVPVHIKLKSRDVIHSFWVPNLAGKQDLIPGRETDVNLRPTRAGFYRGQCAEYCGMQHANMALVVTVESPDDFRRWYDQQLRAAFAPRNPLQLAGYRYVTTRECAMCHSIAGTPASGTVGPDLTHLASRRILAAGAMPMSEGNLQGWIADPQSQKPGTKMPTIGLDADELRAVVAYMESLK